MTNDISNEKMATLSEALLQGRKIEAIKLYREFTGVGLKEAKEAIEHIEAELRAKFPEKFAAAGRGKGCLGLLVFLGLIVIVLVGRITLA